jgi:RNA polymerase sigma factor (sigma-70 family)
MTDGEGVELGFADLSVGPQDRAVRDEQYERLYKAMDRLQPEEQEVLVLRYFRHATTFKKIGEELGVSEFAARRRHTRALEKLQRDLEDSRSAQRRSSRA